MDIVTAFVNELVEEKGLTYLEDDVLDQLKADLSERVNRWIDAAILNNVPEAALGDFEKLLDSEDEQKTSAFIKEQIPNLDQVIATELLKFKQMYLA